MSETMTAAVETDATGRPNFNTHRYLPGTRIYARCNLTDATSARLRALADLLDTYIDHEDAEPVYVDTEGYGNVDMVIWRPAPPIPTTIEV